MNYDEIATGTKFEHENTGHKITFLDHEDRKIMFEMDGRTGSMYKSMFENRYNEVTVEEESEDEQD
jgi:hypothetical protein